MDIKEVTPKKEDLCKKFEATISSAELAEKEEIEFNKIKKTASLKGFRKGKVPTAVLKQNYGNTALVRAFEAIVAEVLTNIYATYKITPVQQPSVKVVSGEVLQKTDLTLAIDVEVMSEIPELNLDSIEVSKVKVVPDDNDLQQALQSLASYYADTAELKEERSAKVGDIASIDFVGKMNGEAFAGGSAENYNLELGSKSFIEGFEDGVVGMNVGETKVLELKFPEEYPNNKELAGKPVSFEVTLKAIKLKTPCKVEDLPAKIGIKDLETLKKDLSARQVVQHQRIADGEIKKELVDKLANLIDFPISEILVKQEMEALSADYERYKQQKDEETKKDATEEEEERRNAAVKRLRVSLIFSKLADENNITVSMEEITNYLKQELSGLPEAQQQKFLKNYLTNKDLVGRVRSAVAEKKIVDYLLSKVKVSEKQMSIQQYTDSLQKKS